MARALATLCFMLLVLVSPSLAQNSRQDYLDPHNAARAQVGVEPLTWSDTLAGYARSYAYQRISDCELEHSHGPYGENLAEGYGNLFSATDAVNLWVGERPNYDYYSNSCVGDECRHYTQVVWRDSVYVGCANLECVNGWRFVICNYDPPGNYVDRRPY